MTSVNHCVGGPQPIPKVDSDIYVKLIDIYDKRNLSINVSQGMGERVTLTYYIYCLTAFLST